MLVKLVAIGQGYPVVQSVQLSDRAVTGVQRHCEQWIRHWYHEWPAEHFDTSVRRMADQSYFVAAELARLAKKCSAVSPRASIHPLVCAVSQALTPTTSTYLLGAE